MALLSRTAQLEVPLPPDAVLSRLEAELRGAPGPMLDGTLSELPAGRAWVGRVEGPTFVLRRAAHGEAWLRNLHAVTRGRVEPVPGGSRLTLTLRPAWLDSPPLWPMLLLSLGGVGIALWDRRPELLGLVALLWCVPLVLGLLGRPLLGWETERVTQALRERLR
jgi:hypothetical protein